MLVVGTTGNDTLTLTPTSTTTATMSIDGSALYSFTNIQNFAFYGAAGDDKMIVDDSTSLLTVPIFYDGDNGYDFVGNGYGDPPIAGNGFNTLVITQTGGATQTSDTYSVGPNVGEGSDVIVGGAGTQTIQFENLAPVQDNVPALSVTVNATPADNAINYAQGPGGGIFIGNTGLITIDNQESYEFNNKTNLIINGLAGSDTINLNYNNLVGPAGLTGSITVNGSDPTASDTLIVNGIAGTLDNLRFVPTAAAAGNVINDNGPQPQVNFTGIEHLNLVVQQNDGDGVRLDGTTGNDNIEFAQGENANSGVFTGTMDLNNATGVGPFALTEMTYFNVNSAGNDEDVNFFNPGGTDSFVFNGTAADDTISVATGEAGGTEFKNTLNGYVVARIEVFNIASGLVRGLAGNDTFNVTVPAGPAAVALRIEGGDSDQFTDTLNYTAPSGAATTINLGTLTITSTGPASNPVTFSGIERLNETSSGAAPR